MNTVTTQTLREVEIIVINDASTDDSRSIIEEYAINDARVRVIDLDVNGGVSAARNLGLEQVRGDYVLFVDGDDFWASPDMLQDLYDRAVRNDSDVLGFGFYRTASDNARPPVGSGNSRTFLLHEEGGWIVTYNIWAKLIARDILAADDMRFDTDLVMGEDAVFSIRLYCRARKLTTYDRIYYCYRINPRSVNNIPWDRNKLFCTAQWFRRGIDLINRCPAFSDRKKVLNSIGGERIRALYNKLGLLALDILDDAALPEYVDLWRNVWLFWTRRLFWDTI